MKKCTRCKEKKSYDLFYKNSKRKDGCQDVCISCKKQQDKEHWNKYKDKWASHYKKSKSEQFQLANNIKAEGGCKKCGEKRYWVLDFHHIDPTKKEREVGKSGSIKTMIKEIKKCIILCRNCHSDFHYLERNEKSTIDQYLNN